MSLHVKKAETLLSEIRVHQPGQEGPMYGARKAETLLSEIRVHQPGQEGPMYGALKADAAVAYALLAVEARLGEIADSLKVSEKCHACTGTGFESTDPEDASPCLRCNGTGNEPRS